MPGPRRLVLLLFAILACATPARAQQRVDYVKEIKPLLREKCFACHGGLQQKAKLRLDTAALAKKGGRSGPAVRPGDVARSLLIERVTAAAEADRMPPEGSPLSPAQVARLKAWIAQGAEAPAGEEPERDPRAHWAFRPPVRPDLPRVKRAAWASNPIDAFLAAEHEKRGLTPRPPADKALLLRRVYLDLIGLPPTRAELHAFCADPAPDAYEKVVDRLLADPRHGERWGRHWMDVWRYSDWYGRRMVPDVWNSAPQIWRWRDWIVRSLNQDHGYDRMVREMLAADEICPDDDDAVVATGFLIRNWYALNPNDWMRSNVEHVGKAFLGLTFNCAHCHDHKYDPITQADYFRFRAFFEPLGIRQDRVAGEADPGPFQEYQYSTLRKVQRQGMVRAFDEHPTAPTWFYTGGDERNRVKDRGSMAPGLPALFGKLPGGIRPVELPARAYYPALQPALREAFLTEEKSAVKRAEAELTAARRAVADALPPLQKQLARVEAELSAASEAAARAGGPGALTGTQSLLLDAEAGRRIVQNGLTGVKSLPDGAVLRFELRILRDAHFNMQLLKDNVRGHTAACVAFEKGRILSYRPGSVVEFEVGRYDLAAGQDRFEVALVLETRANRIRLTVKSRKDGKVLVNQTEVALNAWSPVGDPRKSLAFDARTGSVVLLDEVALEAPGGSPLAAFDFEPPGYREGRDVVGNHGWSVSSFSVPPATSVVTRTAGSPALRAFAGKMRLARRALEASELKVKAAEARLAQAQATLAFVRAAIAADQAKYGEAVGADARELARQASQAWHTAAVRQLEAMVLGHEHHLALLEAKPAPDLKTMTDIWTRSLAVAHHRDRLERFRAEAKAVSEEYPPLGPTYPRTSTGRRKALAEWISSKDNPLTARVAVNHIWMRHFHAPLVASVFDFGRSGARPTHPELLDWLAVDFMESGWSMKKLHRLIVTSQAYRMTSGQGGASDNAARDAENRFLWRMNAGRMEAEVVRDSLLSIAGLLDRKMGGQELENSQALTTRRRSLYYSCNPEGDGKSAFGALFDAPDAGECYRRTRTIIPQQALALTNSDLVHEVSAKLAQALWEGLSAADRETPEAFIMAAYETVLSRRPGRAELAVCVEFLKGHGAPARASLVRALLNHNDFITVR
jgi:hypothetical protein